MRDPKQRIAEWILSVMLSPERAESMVGDWTEDASERGPVWFWSCVIRTVAAHVWSDFVDSPGSLVRLGLVGLCRIVIPLYGFLALFDALLTHSQPVRDWMFSGGPWLVNVLWNVLLLPVWMFQTGRWVARRAPGRIAAGCVAIASSFGIFGLIVDLSLWLAGVPLHLVVFAKVLEWQILCNMLLLAGAISVRHRFRQTATR